MKQIIFLLTMIVVTRTVEAQQFISKATIEYEVKTNIKKTMSNDGWDDMIKDNMSEFKTAYYNYTFADNKSIYKFNRWDDKTRVPVWYKEGDEDNIWYYNFNNGKFTMQKQVEGTNFLIADSFPQLNWKLTNENRVIAGFNCRKAIGKIFDSVYVFAFYTDEITIPGGPCSINGLPGMILGLTIPRLYTSFIATKISVSKINESDIKPLTAKKSYTYSGLKTLIQEKTKEWFSWGDNKEENQRRKNLFLWNIYL